MTSLAIPTASGATLSFWDRLTDWKSRVHDGHLTVGDANAQWQGGNGGPVHVDARWLNYDGLSTNSFGGVGSKISYTFNPVTSLGDFMVHGTVNLIRVSDTHFKVEGPELYDFEMKDWGTRYMRNILTIIGGLNAGSGTPFYIHYDNAVPIPGIKPPQPDM